MYFHYRAKEDRKLAYETIGGRIIINENKVLNGKVAKNNRLINGLIV
jgi:hypothetical protein